jgi:putative ABC transport system permease protein
MGLPISALLVMTWKSLSSDWIRSGLTTLGVFMGVGAVSATLNIQTIASQQIEIKVAARDKPYVSPYVSSNSGFENPQIGQADIQALKQSIPLIRSISRVGYVFMIGSVQFEGQETQDIRVSSVSLNYLETTGRQMLQGRFFNQADLDQYRPVAIIDTQLATTLFQGQNPVHQTIYASGNRLTVIGVTETKSTRFDFKDNGTMWLAESFAKSLQGGFEYTRLQISSQRLEDIKLLKAKVEQVLMQRYPQATVNVFDNADDLLKEKETQEIAAQALTIVGLIALAIGGVGIANITIASVMERTKEIGIRRAIGATRVEIVMQFILEAMLLSLIGGVGAIVVVHGITQFATTSITKAPYSFSVHNAALAMGAALLVGVGSSFLPALRAAQIDVVKALRGE